MKGFPSWNVPLARTLNKLPPSVHENGLSGPLKTFSVIEDTASIPNSDSVMTTSYKDASINIWNTNTKLHRVASYNFKAQLHSEELLNEKMIKELLMPEE